tara:strand:- start:1294 stop:1404 length:111 start_codon:yes stop_codon:yes gene_type:complete
MSFEVRDACLADFLDIRGIAGLGCEDFFVVSNKVSE